MMNNPPIRHDGGVGNVVSDEDDLANRMFADVADRQALALAKANAIAKVKANRRARALAKIWAKSEGLGKLRSIEDGEARWLQLHAAA